MRVPRLTLMDLMIGIPIVGLFCSVPIQCRRAMDADGCQLVAEHSAELARTFTLISDEPAAWMDEFRSTLRNMSSWELDRSRRLARSSVYDREEENRIDESQMAWVDRSAFWVRFSAASTRNGYRQPKTGRGAHRPIAVGGALRKIWPTYCLIGLLILFLTCRRRPMFTSIEIAPF
jgi:hypothetical protein